MGTIARGFTVPFTPGLFVRTPGGERAGVTRAIPGARNHRGIAPVVHVVDIVRALRFVSLAGASSFLLLLVATAVKYGADSPQGVQILGPVHGILFIAYCALVVLTRERTGWDGRRTVLALVGGVLPFAPFFVGRGW